jgi:hypothetical protein
MFPGLAAAMPGAQSDETFPSLAFNASGAIEGGSNPVQLFLYEGYYANQQDVETRRRGDLFEKITPYLVHVQHLRHCRRLHALSQARCS